MSDALWRDASEGSSMPKSKKIWDEAERSLGQFGAGCIDC